MALPEARERLTLAISDYQLSSNEAIQSTLALSKIAIEAVKLLIQRNVELERNLNEARKAIQIIVENPPFDNRLDEISERDPDYKRGCCIYCGTLEGDEHYQSCEWNHLVIVLSEIEGDK